VTYDPGPVWAQLIWTMPLESWNGSLWHWAVELVRLIVCVSPASVRTLSVRLPLSVLWGLARTHESPSSGPDPGDSRT